MVNLGGAITTAGGLVFIGATLDAYVRAFDVETGKELWKTQIGERPGGGEAWGSLIHAADRRMYEDKFHRRRMPTVREVVGAGQRGHDWAVLDLPRSADPALVAAPERPAGRPAAPGHRRRPPEPSRPLIRRSGSASPRVPMGARQRRNRRS